jgi:hypothetical protein
MFSAMRDKLDNGDGTANNLPYSITKNSMLAA